MAGRKRASDSDAVPSTRSSKVAKTDTSATASKPKGAKKGPKAALPASTFKARALPLHINVTHTPPSIVDETTGMPEDPGFIGSTSLVACSFSTGSYGWKGTKRVIVELQNPEGEKEKEKEKVHVMLTINATVVGSKQAKEEETKEAEPEVEAADEHREEADLAIEASKPGGE